MMRYDPIFAAMTADARDHHRQHMSFAALEQHWRDPAPLNAEIEQNRAGYLMARSQGRANDNELAPTLVNRRFAGRTMMYDEELERRVAALNAKQARRWAQENGNG